MHSEIDPGLEEAITTILWVAPRLCADVQELKEVRVAILMTHVQYFVQKVKCAVALEECR